MLMINFWAPWCGACKQLEPVLDEISSETGIKIKKVNIEQDDDHLAAKYAVLSLPTIIVLEAGKVVNCLQGSFSKQYILKQLGI